MKKLLVLMLLATTLTGCKQEYVATNEKAVSGTINKLPVEPTSYESLDVYEDILENMYSPYAQYEDSTCSGTDVIVALKTYADSDIAILVSSDGVTYFNYCRLLDSASAVDGSYICVMDKPEYWNITPEYFNDISATEDKDSLSYIALGDAYTSNVLYDDSGVAKAITFTLE